MSYTQIAIVRGCSKEDYNEVEFSKELRLANAAPAMLATLEAVHEYLLVQSIDITKDKQAAVLYDLVHSAITCAAMPLMTTQHSVLTCYNVILNRLRCCGATSLTLLRLHCRSMATDYSVEAVNAALNDLMANYSVMQVGVNVFDVS